jgi:hypothetical protein
MQRAICALAAVLTLLMFSSGSAKGQYWYYYMDGSQIAVQVFDDLESVS